MNLTPAERECYFNMNPNRCILYRQVFVDVIDEDAPSPTRSKGGQTEMGPVTPGFESFLDQADQGDEQLRKIIADETTVNLARPIGLQLCGTPKSMVDEMAKAQFEFISVLIVSTGDWPTLMRRMDNIKRCGIISPTIKERASVKRKLQSDYVNPNDLELEATPTKLPKQDPRVRVTNGNVESIMEQLSSETSKALKSAVEDIFDTDMDLSDRSCSTPPSPLAVSSDDSRFGGLNGSAALTNSESGLDTLPDDSHDSVTGNDSFLESLASENEQLKKKYEAQERELIKLRRTGLQQAALLQKLGESTSQSATSTQTQPNVALRPTQNTPPPVVPSQGQVGVQQVPRVDDSLFPPSPPSPPSQHQRQHQETEEQQLQQNQQQRQEGASHPAPVASESVRSYVRKAYYPLPTGDYVLDPSLVRRAPSEMNAFARFMLVGLFGRDGIKGRSLYGGSVKTNTIETRPPLDPHKMNAILNLCQQRFGRKDPAFEGKFGNAARNKLPKNRSKA